MDYCSRNEIPLFVRNDSNIRSEPPLSAPKRWLKRRLYAWWLKRASGVMSMGELGDQFFLKYGANAQHLYRVPYWPDYDAFAHVDPDALARFRRKYGLQEGRRRILFSGRLVPAKRVDLLIDAFAAVAAGRPDWDLMIVGDGPLQHELRSRVPKSLSGRVVWTGFLDGDEAKLAYHVADVLVLPSDREPWAVVVQEAMAAGVIVVASDVSGAAHELIQDGKSGRIFPAGNLAQLSQAVLDVTDPQALTAYRERVIAALVVWRQTVDPIAEIRRALADFNVLKRPATTPETPEKSYQACKA
jgi:glycosyltransferase involved in cell wall biosynthesis